MMQNALHAVRRASAVSSWILTSNITSFRMSPLTASRRFHSVPPPFKSFQNEIPHVLFMSVYFLIRINLSDSNGIVS